MDHSRACLKTLNGTDLAEFSFQFQARRIFAGVPGVRQENATQHGAKRRGEMPLNGFSDTT